VLVGVEGGDKWITMSLWRRNEVINESGIYPVGHRVLILPEQIEEKTEGGIILHTGSQKAREEMAQINGVVVELGTTAYSDQPSTWCELGDKVIFGKYSGLIYDGQDGKKYRILNDLDVVAIVKKGKTNE